MPKVYGVPILRWVEMSPEERKRTKELYKEKLKRLKEICKEVGVNSIEELMIVARIELFRDSVEYLSYHSCGNCIHFESSTLPDVFWVIEHQVRPCLAKDKHYLVDELIQRVKKIRFNDKQRREEVCNFCKKHLEKEKAELICKYLNTRRNFCKARRAIVQPEYKLPLALNGCEFFRPKTYKRFFYVNSLLISFWRW